MTKLDKTAKQTVVALKVKSFQSEELFDGLKSLQILHNNETYLLRITANNKLILTK